VKRERAGVGEKKGESEGTQNEQMANTQ